MKIYKEKKILFLVSVLVLAAVLIALITPNAPMVLLASNIATQGATTTKADTITIVGKVADGAVATITFPEGAPSAVISAPYNDVDGTGDPQFLSTTSSEPVVRLKNTSGGALKTWLDITTWTSGIAASEHYEIVATSATGTNAVASALSSDGNAATVNTTVEIPTLEYRALYLKLTLSSLAGRTGTSTLSVLGETP